MGEIELFDFIGVSLLLEWVCIAIRQAYARSIESDSEKTPREIGGAA
jgi:hypothetical protein